MSEKTSDIIDLKERLKHTWNAGDYGVVAKDLESSAAVILSRIPFERGTQLLDLACGTGQFAFPTARAGAKVTGVDIAPKLIEQARARGSRNRLTKRSE